MSTASHSILWHHMWAWLTQNRTLLQETMFEIFVILLLFCVSVLL